MRKIDYNQKEKYTGNTSNHVATDQPMEEKFGNLQRAYNESFGASSGVRPATAESDGKAEHPEELDESHPSRVTHDVDDENAGLADN